MAETIASLKKEVAKLKKEVAKQKKQVAAEKAKAQQRKSKFEDIFLNHQFNWTEFLAAPDDILKELFG